MALPGFNPLGQALVQFMIVWHRYTENGSLIRSSRSLVASSRESTIQRYAYDLSTNEIEPVAGLHFKSIEVLNLSESERI
jgi:hypothetical protein